MEQPVRFHELFGSRYEAAREREELKVGDEVVRVHPTYTSTIYRFGEVVKVTKTQVTVEFEAGRYAQRFKKDSGEVIKRGSYDTIFAMRDRKWWFDADEAWRAHQDEVRFARKRLVKEVRGKFETLMQHQLTNEALVNLGNMLDQYVADSE